jgi:hypothetical protein
VKPKHMRQAARLAVGLAVDLDARLPEWCSPPLGELLAAVMPLAMRLARLERRASRSRKHARRYRRAVRHARREVEQLLATQDGRLASMPDLMRSVPFSADAWRVSLTPGAPVGVAAETEAA